jgi:hypothetical protein
MLQCIIKLISTRIVDLIHDLVACDNGDGGDGDDDDDDDDDDESVN